MALTRERKNLSWIAREIHFFSNFACLVSSFHCFPAAQFIDRGDWLMVNIFETFGWRKIAVSYNFPCGMLFLLLAQKQVQIWGCCLSWIVSFRSPNYAQRWTLVYWNRINQHFAFWEKIYSEMEFQPLGNESLPFCRTKWFQNYIKIAFFHLSVWLIGQGGWKFCHRPGLGFWQFAVQAEKRCWAENCKILLFITDRFFKRLHVLIQY